MRQTKAARSLDRQIEAFYYRHAQGLQISVMDIPPLFRAARAAHDAGQDLEQTIVGLIATYRATGRLDGAR